MLVLKKGYIEKQEDSQSYYKIIYTAEPEGFINQYINFMPGYITYKLSKTVKIITGEISASIMVCVEPKYIDAVTKHCDEFFELLSNDDTSAILTSEEIDEAINKISLNNN